MNTVRTIQSTGLTSACNYPRPPTHLLPALAIHGGPPAHLLPALAIHGGPPAHLLPALTIHGGPAKADISPAGILRRWQIRNDNPSFPVIHPCCAGWRQQEASQRLSRRKVRPWEAGSGERCSAREE